MELTLRDGHQEDGLPNLDKELGCLSNNITDVKRVVFYVGAGLSVSSGYPLWATACGNALKMAEDKGLASGASAYTNEKLKNRQYYEAFEVLKSELPEPTFFNIVRAVFGGRNQASDLQRSLVRVNARGIITTNFDECLLSAYVLERGGTPLRDMRYAMASDEYFLVQAHGSIQEPRSMVLTTSDWRRIEGQGQFRDLVAQLATNNQVIFLGYGLADPDFNHAWDQILRERVFRSSAILCCPTGSVPGARLAELRDKNVMTIEFPDDGSFAFIQPILDRLVKSSQCISTAMKPSPAKHTVELERYVLLCLHFSRGVNSRLVLVCKAIVLEYIATRTGTEANLGQIVRYVTNTIGQDSDVVQDATKAALRELSAESITIEGDTVRYDAGFAAGLAASVHRDERAEIDWVARTLRSQALRSGIELQDTDVEHVTAMLDKVLMAAGNEIAELLLFNRPQKGDLERVEEVVDSYCRTNNLQGRAGLYRKCIKRLVFDPAEGDEDLLFKRLQAFFIASAFVMNPTSEKLLAEYAKDHWVYLDSSILLPAIAIGHPAHAVYRRLLHDTRALGMKLKVTRDMLDEVRANLRSARKAFDEFRATGVNLQETLEGYVELNGTGNGNVFLEGFLNQLTLDPALTPEGYLRNIFGDTGKNPEETALTEMYSVEVDDLRSNEVDSLRLAEVTGSIEHLRKQGGRFKTRLLCEHEAKQFVMVHIRREQNPALAGKIWFLTTDHFICELQRLERQRYPLPISYTPRAWYQYLDLIDTDRRGSKNFSRLQPKMRFGVVTGELGIEAMRTILSEQKNLLVKGIVTVKELAEAAVREFHVRQSISNYDRAVGSRSEHELNKAKERIRSDMSTAVRQFVAVRTQELERIQAEKKAAEAKVASVEKRLAKEQHVTRTLRAQLQPRKRRRKSH